MMRGWASATPNQHLAVLCLVYGARRAGVGCGCFVVVVEGVVMLDKKSDELFRLRAMCDDRKGTWDLSDRDKAAIYAAVCCIEEQRDLLDRAMAIIADAIMHGMPITQEVADVRNAICGVSAAMELAPDE